ncbi:MAG: chemotaxis protein CheC [Clostridia bacterium]|nr:chemotaxis protein CheC [Clostridia bacterium]MDH7573481.1 chemotaxis protein CheC [Clostridia bacterium]
MDVWNGLSNLQVDAIREIGNIGAGSAATALAQMMNQRIQMSVPRAGVMPLEDIIRLVGGEEEPVACVTTVVTGQAPSLVLYLLSASAAFGLVDLLLGRPSGSTTDLGEMEKSVLSEVGNILTGSFLTAFSQMTGLSLLPSVPVLAFDMLGAVISAALVEGGYYEDRVLVIETVFSGTNSSISSHFFLAPQAGSLEAILKAVGLA